MTLAAHPYIVGQIDMLRHVRSLIHHHHLYHHPVVFSVPNSGGYELPEWTAADLRDHAVNALTWLAKNIVMFYSGALNVLSTTSGIMVSFVTFFSFLWYLLKQVRSTLCSSSEPMANYGGGDGSF